MKVVLNMISNKFALLFSSTMICFVDSGWGQNKFDIDMAGYVLGIIIVSVWIGLASPIYW